MDILRELYRAGMPVPACVIVGTRSPEPDQVLACQAAARAAAERGVLVISGGALGIDTIAATEAAQHGGQVINVLPYPMRRSLPGVMVVQPPVDDYAKEMVRRVHPAPERLSPVHIVLHARNLRMVELLHQIRRERAQVGADLRHCVVVAIPRWTDQGPVGGTMMTIRFAEQFGIPVIVWKPGEGWQR